MTSKPETKQQLELSHNGGDGRTRPRAYFVNSLSDWLLAAAAFLVFFYVLPVIQLFVVARSWKLVGREAPGWITRVLLLITRTRRLFLAAAFYVAERFLDLLERVEDVSTALIVLTFWIQAALWGVAAGEVALKQR